MPMLDHPQFRQVASFTIHTLHGPLFNVAIFGLRYIKDWLCLCLLLSYQKVRGWSIFHSNHVISMRLGHGLRLVEMVILTLKFPW